MLLKQIHDMRPLGELAIEEGLFTRRDLAELLLQQAEDAVTIAQALVEMGIFSAEEAAEQLLSARRTVANGAQTELGLSTAV